MSKAANPGGIQASAAACICALTPTGGSPVAKAVCIAAASAGFLFFARAEAQAAPKIVRAMSRMRLLLIPDPFRQMQDNTLKLFQGIQHRTVALLEKMPGDMYAIIEIDADQVGIECGVVDLGQRQAVGHDRLAQQFVPVGNDVRRIEQAVFAQSRQGAATAVCGDDGFSK